MKSNRRGYCKSLRVYRFVDTLAVNIDASDGGQTEPHRAETIYLSPAMVDALALSLAEFRADFVRNPPGPGSEFKTRTVTDDGRTIRP